MIAGCPTCAARYRIDTAKLRPEGARLRCSRCETVFRVTPPPAAPSAAPAAAQRSSPPAAPVRAVPPAAVRRSSPPAAQRPPAPPAPPDPAKRVLIAHPEIEAGKAVADALSSWGLSVVLVHDGVEAILQIQRTLPRIVVLDAALPKMFGFQVCEMMKRNEQLRAIPVVLVGAIHNQDRYRRPPGELYGADAYVERQDLPGALAEHLVRFGVQASPVATPPRPLAPRPPARAAVPRPAPRAPLVPMPASAPAAPPPATPAVASPEAEKAERRTGGERRVNLALAAASPESEKADRLARIIVSDVILYNAAKFEAAVRAGNVLDALSAELEEGYSLFSQRVDPRVCNPREHLQRELMRVARLRGMK